MTSIASPLTALKQTWQAPEGVVGWFTAVNHRTIGARYIATGMVFFVLAGIGALLIRIQLLVPENTFLNPDLYNQLFTMHGTTMMFLFAVPIMEGIGIYLIPLLIGARDMAFPRLNAFGYFVYLISGVVLYISLLFGSAPDGGWFAYVPLTGPEYSPGLNIDFYTTLITFVEVAALVAAVELIVTIFKMRAPGMTLNRMPLMVWAILVMAFMIIFAMPAVMVATVELALDRSVGTQFFNPEQGGDPLLWQHLFWFFGHPEVYIIFVPALGIVASIIPTFSRRPIVGYTPLVLSLVAIGIISFGLWVHHMFTSGLPLLGMSFFAVASFMIAIPSGVQIFSGLATMWYGKVSLKTPMLYVIGFILIFVIGGITGVMVAAVPFDWQVHDTYFVVAHFHYVLIGGAVFPLLGGIHYWLPKITGRMMSERLGRWEFALLFIGFNVAFGTMHLTGFLGMPRRVYTYLPGLGWDVVNVISTVGAFVFAAGVLVFLINVLRSLQLGAPAGDNPWNASTLEWATSSPPPPYNFAQIPVVRSRDPLWEEPEQVERVEDEVESENQRLMMKLDRRETLGTSILDAKPQMRIVLPGPTIVPFLTAVAASVTFISAMINLAFVPVGMLLVFIMLVVWHWPRTRELSISKAGPVGALPTSVVASHHGAHPPIWWGMIFLILIETVVFASLVASYFYLRAGAEIWPIEPVTPPDLLLPSINALLLFASSIPIHLADSGIRKGNQRRLKIGLVVGFLMGAIFLVLKAVEYSGLDYNWANNAYTSVVWTITGFHSLHVLALLLKTAVMIVLAFQNYFNEERHSGVGANGLYWHFVVAAWVPLFFTLYLSPRLI